MRSSLSLVGRAEVTFAALAIAIAVVGATVLPLTTPLYVHALVRAVHAERLTGLSSVQTLEAAEAVRRFVVDADAPPLPAELGGRPAFDAQASSHLIDVRNVILPARTIAVVLTAAALLWVGLRARSAGGKRIVGAALRGASAGLIASMGVALVVGLADFDALFTWFHGLFFAPGTWLFSEDALLIQVFPLPFWTAAGATWAILALAAAGVLFISARRLCFTSTNVGV